MMKLSSFSCCSVNLSLETTELEEVDGGRMVQGLMNSSGMEAVLTLPCSPFLRLEFNVKVKERKRKTKGKREKVG